ncbi:MAG: HAMP domain-containing histidine kinase [Saprospiraceae bacterium]|nr:HAMP domain-containing histidine kinase [Saprospiraceae bacterium]
MDINNSKTQWKLALALSGLLIVVVSLIYSNYVTTKLAAEEAKRVNLFLMAYEGLLDETNTDVADLSLNTEVIKSNTTIPVILVNDEGYIEGRNFGEKLDNDSTFLKKEIALIKKEGKAPIKSFHSLIYYKDSNLLRLLKYYPFFQLFLVASFIGLGYIGLSTSRKAEQNRVWVGMAKETAHQLGTPISGIVAWIEHLQDLKDDDEHVNDILKELRHDVSRLELIADRFSKIGSTPVLEKTNIYLHLDNIKNYMSKRAPRKVTFDFPSNVTDELIVNLNPPLFNWVLENLLRNALDALEGKGLISASVYTEDNFTCIDISDTGKGIPASKYKTVFQPGFTTKKRGWGLGLSLAKRIIEEYHNGKIFVKKSNPTEGTTFTIKLPNIPSS